MSLRVVFLGGYTEGQKIVAVLVEGHFVEVCLTPQTVVVGGSAGPTKKHIFDLNDSCTDSNTAILGSKVISRESALLLLQLVAD